MTEYGGRYHLIVGSGDQQGGGELGLGGLFVGHDDLCLVDEEL